MIGYHYFQFILFWILFGKIKSDLKCENQQLVSYGPENFDVKLPVLVSLNVGGKRRCTITLIDPSVFLTSADCVYDIPIKKIQLKLESYPNFLIPNIDRIVLHPYYRSNKLSWNMALIFLKHEFKLIEILGVYPIESNVQNLNFPLPGFVVRSDMFYTCESVTVLDAGLCEKNHFGVIECLAQHYSEPASCNGDVGGPVFINNKIVALINGDYDCKNFPDFDRYTSAEDIYPWVDYHVNEKVYKASLHFIIFALGAIF